MLLILSNILREPQAILPWLSGTPMNSTAEFLKIPQIFFVVVSFL
jgi:hypothetical protein